MTYLRIPSNAIALAAVCLTSLMFGLEISSVPVILPTLRDVLHADFKDMQWIMNAYTIACTTVLMATGTLADRFGRKRLYLITIVIFGLTSLLCGVASSAPMLIASRFAQGVGGGAMLICQVAVLSHQFREGRERSRAFAMWGIVFGSGLGFGPIIGGSIVALANWHWVFLVHIVVSVVALLCVLSGVEESRDPHAEHLDLAGMITLSLSVFGLAFLITQGPDMGLASLRTVGIFALTLGCFIAFLIAERVATRPMFDFSVLRIRPFSGALVGSAGMNFSFWPFMIYLPIYFRGVLGYSSVTAGLSLLAYTLPTLVVPPFAERLMARHDPRAVIPAGLFTIGLGFMLMWLGSRGAQASWLTMLPGCLFAGIGLGLTNTPVTNTTTGAVSAHRAGMASGIDMSARLISLAINIAIMGLILVEGILVVLRQALPDTMNESALRAFANAVCTGEFSLTGSGSAETAFAGLTHATVHLALVHGFGWVMLYGGIAAWAAALLSRTTFGSTRAKVDVGQRA
ncbi:Drug resistance transporter, EmrB/QacA subfamily [Pararobbsia alpina]|uniref:MFS transporter n=1 Tax=Pararobbsia alpina TaxID=621374 RepID=UPI0039A5A057